MENRVERLRQHIEKMSLDRPDVPERRQIYVHLYGVSQACALIALKRNESIELATMAGMLHDIYTYTCLDSQNHAEKGALLAKEILEQLKLTSSEETAVICSAIHNHSAKARKHSAFDEVLIDADVMHHWLHNATKPVMPHEEERVRSLIKEFGLLIKE